MFGKMQRAGAKAASSAKPPHQRSPQTWRPRAFHAEVRAHARAPRANGSAFSFASTGLDPATAVPLQTKVEVGADNDPLETEADQIADRVVGMQSPHVRASEPQVGGLPVNTALQRKCAECEEGDKLQRRPSQTAPTNVSQRPVPPIVMETLRSPGQSLEAPVRDYMESRFARAFGDVRVHSDARAAQSAAAVGARAYTVGRHVVFAPGEYAPQFDRGRRLLAHELAHTIQQRGGAAGPVLHRQAAERAYDIQLTYPPNQTVRYHALPQTDALRALHMFGGLVSAHLEGGYDGHRYLHDIHNDQYVVAGVSDFVARRSIPPLSIWDEPRARLRAARALIEQQDVARATSELQASAEATRAADRRVVEYREGTISGAEVAVLGLQVVEVAMATIVAVGTGGTAGLVVGAGYAGAQRLAGEASSVAIGLQDRIDWGGIAFDTLFALVAGRFGARFGSAVAGRVGAALAPRLGPLASRVTTTLITSLIVGRASGLIHAAAREVFDSVRNQTELTMDGFIHRLAEQLTLRAAFLDLVAAAVGWRTEQAMEEPSPSGPAPPSGRRLSGPTHVVPAPEAGEGPSLGAGGRAPRQLPAAQEAVPFVASGRGATALDYSHIAAEAPAPLVRQSPALQVVPEPARAAAPVLGGRPRPSGSTYGAVAVEAAAGPASGGAKKKRPNGLMLSQIQQGRVHYGDAVATAGVAEKGVTAYEFEMAQAAAKADALLPRDPIRDPTGREKQMPRSYIPGVDKAKAEQSKRIRTGTVPSGGIPADRIGDINELRVCFDPRTTDLVDCEEDGAVRLDVENIEGHNLRYAR